MGTAGKTVMLVEDEPNIIVAISFILQRAGWRVATHSNGATALDEIARVCPDMLILDVMLPNRSGFDILADIRAGRIGGAAGLAALPVLMLTAKGQAKDRARAEGLGADMFLTKPFANQDILEAVEHLMSLRA